MGETKVNVSLAAFPFAKFGLSPRLATCMTKAVPILPILRWENGASCGWSHKKLPTRLDNRTLGDRYPWLCGMRG
eukprot:scaffold18380_cov30-Tisochrysis_lutea.AAC.3